MSHSIVTRIVLCDDDKLLGMAGLAVYQSARNPKEAYVGCHAAGNNFLGVTMSPLISKRSAQAVVVDGVVEAMVVCNEENGNTCGILPIGYPIIANNFESKFKDCNKHALTYIDRQDFDSFNALPSSSIAGIFIQSTGQDKAIVKIQKSPQLSYPLVFTLDIGNATFYNNSSAKNTGVEIVHTARLFLKELEKNDNKEFKHQAQQYLDLSPLPNAAQVADAMFNPSSPLYKQSHNLNGSVSSSKVNVPYVKDIVDTCRKQFESKFRKKPSKSSKQQNAAKRPKIAGRP